MTKQNLNPDVQGNEQNTGNQQPDQNEPGREIPVENFSTEDAAGQKQLVEEARIGEASLLGQPHDDDPVLPSEMTSTTSDIYNVSEPSNVIPPSQSHDAAPIFGEGMADAAKENAGVAADAFRRGVIQESAVDPDASRDDRLIGFLCYLIPFAMSILVLLSESSRKRSFQRYHAVQSLGLNTVFGILWFATAVGVVVVQIIPFIGSLIFVAALCLSPIAFLISVITMLYYGNQAYHGRRFAIPGLTTFLQDQGWLTS